MATKPSTEPRRGLFRATIWQVALMGAGYLAKQLITKPEFRRKVSGLATRAARSVGTGLGRGFDRLTGRDAYNGLHTEAKQPWQAPSELGGEA